LRLCAQCFEKKLRAKAQRTQSKLETEATKQKHVGATSGASFRVWNSQTPPAARWAASNPCSALLAAGGLSRSRRFFDLAAGLHKVDQVGPVGKFEEPLPQEHQRFRDAPAQGFGHVAVPGVQGMALLFACVGEYDAIGLVAEFQSCHQLPPPGQRDCNASLGFSPEFPQRVGENEKGLRHNSS
jgi:hypothetical protein